MMKLIKLIHKHYPDIAKSVVGIKFFLIAEASSLGPSHGL